MIKLIYKVDPKNKDSELQWLREQKIYPSTQDWFDWPRDGKHYIQFGMIVNEQQALSVKLRHPLQFQGEYRQR